MYSVEETQVKYGVRNAPKHAPRLPLVLDLMNAESQTQTLIKDKCPKTYLKSGGRHKLNRKFKNRKDDIFDLLKEKRPDKNCGGKIRRKASKAFKHTLKTSHDSTTDIHAHAETVREASNSPILREKLPHEKCMVTDTATMRHGRKCSEEVSYGEENLSDMVVLVIPEERLLVNGIIKSQYLLD